MPSGQTLATVTELDLSHSALKLKSVDLTQLRAIRKLSLAYNSLQSKHLSKCRLTALVTLTDVLLLLLLLLLLVLLLILLHFCFFELVGFVIQSSFID